MEVGDDLHLKDDMLSNYCRDGKKSTTEKRDKTSDTVDIRKVRAQKRDKWFH